MVIEVTGVAVWRGHLPEFHRVRSLKGMMRGGTRLPASGMCSLRRRPFCLFDIRHWRRG